jgi:hypothetical protein
VVDFRCREKAKKNDWKDGGLLVNQGRSFLILKVGASLYLLEEFVHRTCTGYFTKTKRD